MNFNNEGEISIMVKNNLLVMGEVEFTNLVMENIENHLIRDFAIEFIGFDHYEKGIETEVALSEAYVKMSEEQFYPLQHKLKDLVALINLSIDDYKADMAQRVRFKGDSAQYVSILDKEQITAITFNIKCTFDSVRETLPVMEERYLTPYTKTFLYTYFKDMPLEDLSVAIEQSITGRGTDEAVADIISAVADKYQYDYLSMTEEEKLCSIIRVIDDFPLAYGLEDTYFSYFDDYKKYTGQKFTIIRKLTTEDGVDDEAGTSYIIRLESGEVIQALEEEICKGGYREHFNKK